MDTLKDQLKKIYEYSENIFMPSRDGKIAVFIKVTGRKSKRCFETCVLLHLPPSTSRERNKQYGGR